MIRQRSSPKRQPRGGFTLIELLVVISIIAVLASLIAPAVQGARKSARKLECLNNMKQVSVAIQNFASNTGGALPNLTSNLSVNGTNTSGAPSRIYGAGWPIALLPLLDAAALQRGIKANATVDATTGYAYVRTGNDTETIWVPAFTCPEDLDSFRTPGGLSFVLNAGFVASTVWGNTPISTSSTVVSGTSASTGEVPYILGSTPTPGTYHQPYMIDWNGNGIYSKDGLTPTGSGFDAADKAIALATGVFHRTVPMGTDADQLAQQSTPIASSQLTSNQMSLDYIANADGLSQTMMVSENLNAGTWSMNETPLASTASGYTGVAQSGVNHIGFAISIPIDSSNKQKNTSLFDSGANGTTNNNYLQTHADFLSTTKNPDYWQINRNLTTATVGSAPRPSSQHAGGVNVFFCDGSGRFISEQIDKRVYAKLMTSNGSYFGETTLDSGSY